MPMNGYDIEFEICKPTTKAGDWALIWGRVLHEGRAIPSAEVWIKVNGKYVKNRLTEEKGFYMFHFRAYAGIYELKPVVYRLRVGNEELIIDGPTKRLIVIPSLKPKRLKSAYEVRTFRKITLGEIRPLLPNIKSFLMKELGASEVYLAGSLASKGYSYHDVDFIVDVPVTPELREEMRDKLRRRYCLNAEVFDFRTWKKGGEVIKL